MNQPHTLLLQLPIPQLNVARQMGNIPLGITYLKMAADIAGLGPVSLLSQSLASHLGDAALFDTILLRQPDTVGFVVYTWNLDRSLYLAHRLKAAYGPRILFGGPEVTLDNDEIRAIAEIQTFSDQQIAEALGETQEQFNLYLSPFPDLDLSGCNTGFLQGNGNIARTMDCLEGETITNLFINKQETPMRLGGWSGRLAHPYQLVFGRQVVDQTAVFEMIRGFSAINPFTPFEVVLVEPKELPSMERLWDACQLQQSHSQGDDLRRLYPVPGNRALLVTVLSRQKTLFFEGPMQRQVLWWEEDHLPDRRDLAALETLDGIFIPDGYTDRVIDGWLTQWTSDAGTLPRITFANPAARKKWFSLAMADDCRFDLLSSNAS